MLGRGDRDLFGYPRLLPRHVSLHLDLPDDLFLNQGDRSSGVRSPVRRISLQLRLLGVTKSARDLGVDPRTVFRHLEKESDDGSAPPEPTPS